MANCAPCAIMGLPEKQPGHESMNTSAKLIFFCGKMAAGKSTLARHLADREEAVLLVQDDFLEALFPGEIADIPTFVKCSSRLRKALTPHVCALLSKGISVVLDFPSNTREQVTSASGLRAHPGAGVRVRRSTFPSRRAPFRRVRSCLVRRPGPALLTFD
jgi:chloramphenicol 3-O-phosphotransferase